MPTAPMKNNPARTVIVPEPNATFPTTVCRAVQPTANSANPPASSIPPTQIGSGRSSSSGKLSANAAIKSLKIPPAKLLFHEPEGIGRASVVRPAREIATVALTPSSTRSRLLGTAPTNGLIRACVRRCIRPSLRSCGPQTRPRPHLLRASALGKVPAIAQALRPPRQTRPEKS